jgi:enoyl-CoA hydratase
VEKSFVAGADISEFFQFSVEEGAQLAHRTRNIQFVENLKIPVIAAVNGFALGGGLELAMSCHIRVALIMLKWDSRSFFRRYTRIRRNTTPQLIGKGRAMEMIMTAGMVSADDAYRTGLVNHVVPQAALLEFCNGIAQKKS